LQRSVDGVLNGRDGWAAAFERFATAGKETSRLKMRKRAENGTAFD